MGNAGSEHKPGTRAGLAINGSILFLRGAWDQSLEKVPGFVPGSYFKAEFQNNSALLRPIFTHKYLIPILAKELLCFNI